MRQRPLLPVIFYRHRSYGSEAASHKRQLPARSDDPRPDLDSSAKTNHSLSRRLKKTLNKTLIAGMFSIPTIRDI